MAQNFFAQFPPEEPDEDAYFGPNAPDVPPFDPDDAAPSTPIILISAAFGIGLAVVSLYVAYQLLGMNIQISAGIATLALSLGLGISGALLSSLTESRAAVANIFFSCGLVVATLLFFGLCTLVGAIAATLLLTMQYQ